MTKQEENIKATQQQSKEIQDTIKINPIKHAVEPEKKRLGETIEMGEKLKHTAENQISIGLDKFEEKLAKQRMKKIE